METVKLTAQALRRILGESFDYSEFEQGRKDARTMFQKEHDERAAKLSEVKRVIEQADFRNRPGISYWVGCLCEADFYWPKTDKSNKGDEAD